MSDLRSLASLQARVYEFLEQQDEATLQALTTGAVRLTIEPSDAPSATVPARPARRGGTPSRDPLAAAQDLSGLRSEQKRREYLAAARLRADGLRAIARIIGVRGYSHLTVPALTDLLARHQLEDSGASADSAPPQPDWATPNGPPSVDADEIAVRLREIETEEQGAAFLRDQHLDRAGLLAVAAALQLTRVDRLSPADLEKRVLKQAIGARRKFAGLRRW